ncbi:hypothetical protein ONZ45_g1089 [Pleurotus djamor]|nr:hypothetical protein ONZ45_g1089 [Pleurotus djamor]
MRVSDDNDLDRRSPVKQLRKFTLPSNLKWIPANWTWSKMKPVIRCAVAAWAGTVLFLIPRVEIFMGQASFLILIASFLSPPSDPFMSVLERELIILLFVATAWAWSSLGIKLADLARRNRDPTASFNLIFSGYYVEAAPTVILAVFIFFGSTFFLYIKARQGPGPYLFATIFACICIDISLTTNVLFPYPFYQIGEAIFIPLAFHSAISLICSCILFPCSISAQFTQNLINVLNPLQTALSTHRKLLHIPHDTTEYTSTVAALTQSVSQSESSLIPLAAASRLLKSDLIYSKFAPLDWKSLQQTARRMAPRANGLGVYWSMIDPEKQRFPITPMTSVPGTPKSQPGTPRGSVPGTPVLGSPTLPVTQAGSQPTVTQIFLGIFTVIPTCIRFIYKAEFAVGVFESQRYLNLEATRLHDPAAVEHTKQANTLLQQSCEDLVVACEDGVQEIISWLTSVRQGTWRFVRDREREKVCRERCNRLISVRERLAQELCTFKADKRHKILDPYRPAFEPHLRSKLHSELDVEDHDHEDLVVPQHKYLFRCYVYQYHLLQLSSNILDMIDGVLKMENERPKNKLWTPANNILFSWSYWEASDSLEKDDDENPEVIQGIQPAWNADLGEPKPRDPDALPPRNSFELVMNAFYRLAKAAGHGNMVFAIKAGILTVIMCLPSMIKASSGFAYRNRFVWAIFMGQLTLARFRGDTTFGLTARVLATFFGCIVGMVMWYISAGSGGANAYGLGAVCAVCFPFFFFARLYWPGPPMTNIIFFVTAILVVGYSYQDNYIVVAASPGSGWDVAWRRFLLVTVGVSAAFLFSFFPPSTTIRRYQRTTLSTTAAELGALYCAIISFANAPKEDESQSIITSLIAVRSKLKRSIVLKANVIYEFSLRGRWPAKRYQKILELQLQIAYSLSHLMSVVEHMEPAWTRAFLRRTRFLDSDFQGDVLAVISMISTALRTGHPLPQITPCPLLDRYMERNHGLNVIHVDSEEDYGLPRNLSLSTLENEQYLRFCVGVSTAYGIMTQLDRLMVATKEIVGEQYHIHGIGLGPLPRAEEGFDLLGRMCIDSDMLPLDGSSSMGAWKSQKLARLSTPLPYFHTLVMAIITDFAAQKLIDEEIQTEIARHEQCIKALKIRRNAHCAINQLPDDILSHILHLVKLQSKYTAASLLGREPWFKILCICHAWRDLVLSNPRYWSTIDLGSPHASQMLQHSKSAPLRIVLRVPDEPNDKFWPLVATVVTQPTRLQVLDVYLTDLTELSRVLSFIPSEHHTVPILEKLTIDLRYASPGQCPRGFWSQLPSLRSLALNRVPLPTMAQFGPNLVDISVWSSPPGSLPSVAWLLGVFQTAQAIQYVSLSDLCGPPVDSSFPIISLPALRKFSLRSDDLTTLSIFNKLDMPCLTQFRLSYTSAGFERSMPLSSLWNTLARMLALPASIDRVIISLNDEFKFVVYFPGDQYSHYMSDPSISCRLPSIPQPEISDHIQLCDVIPFEKSSVLELRHFNGGDLGSTVPEIMHSAKHITTLLLSNCAVQVLGQLLKSSSDAPVPTPELRSLVFDDTDFCNSSGQDNMFNTLLEVVLERKHDRKPIEKVVFTWCDISEDAIDELKHHVEVDWDGNSSG